MSDESNKKNKIGGVSGTKASKGIERTHSIDQVEQVKKTGEVTATGVVGTRSKRPATRSMTFAEREALFKMIDQEAEKMFVKSGLSKEHQTVVQQAVKMAVDASTILDEEPES